MKRIYPTKPNPNSLHKMRSRTIAAIVMAMFVLIQATPAFALRAKEAADDGKDKGTAATIERFLSAGPVVVSDELRADIRHGRAAATGEQVLAKVNDAEFVDKLKQILVAYGLEEGKDINPGSVGFDTQLVADLGFASYDGPGLLAAIENEPDAVGLKHDFPDGADGLLETFGDVTIATAILSIHSQRPNLFDLKTMISEVKAAQKDAAAALAVNSSEASGSQPAAATGLDAAKQRVQDGVAVVISQYASIDDLARIKQEVMPFGIEFKDVVRVATVKEIEDITDPIVVILNYVGNVLSDAIISYAEKNKIAIIDMSGKEPSEVTKAVEQAV